MTLFVDTSVWSLALRRDVEAIEPEVQALKDALFGSDIVVTTGLVLQELLQGFSGAKAKTQIIERFAALPLLQPDRDDHIGAAALRNACRQAGVQLGTIDALLAQLAIRHDLTLLTTDKDFTHAAKHCELCVWPAKARANALLLSRRIEILEPVKPHDLGFTYRIRKSGEVAIFHHGRLASTLRGNDAEDFKQGALDESSADAQQLMARLTGNYKHGNERKASEHHRNRR